MLKARTALLLLAVPLGGCGGPDLDAKAKDSVNRLGEQEQAAAQVLVELEDVVRDEDAAALCRRVYSYRGSQPECERSVEEVFDRQRTVAIEVEDVALRGDTAIAHATVTTLSNDDARSTENHTIRLVLKEQDWRVEFQQ